MKRTIDVAVGILLFGSGAILAWECYTFLLTPFFRAFIIHPSWFWAVALVGTVAAFSAVCLLRWRKRAALIGAVAELILAVLLLQVNYADSAVALLISALVAWRFLRASSSAVIRAEV